MKKHLIEFFLLTLGSFMDAAGFYFFLAPNHVAAGGINGMALVLKTVFPGVPLGLMVLAMSLVLLIIGFLLMGTGFGLKTVYCSILIPLFILGLEHLYPLNAPLANDLLVQLFFGVLLSSMGLAILFNHNAASGGTDILARIFNKFYRIDLGKGMFMIDFLIVMAAGVAFGFEKGMYGLLGLILYGIIIDSIIEGIDIKKSVTIITSCSEDVRAFIVNDLSRGATIYTARGGFTGQTHEIVVTIISRREFIRLRNYIKELDPSAFITVQNIHEVLGEGFASME
jgi:uncharacterized membrane-anchored protein YitT (DUF2179 family)